VLVGAFAAFVGGAVGGPWLALKYWREATVADSALVACRTGSCALEVPSAPPVAHRAEDAEVVVHEGTTLRTDGRSKGFIRLPDGSTVNLEPSTALELTALRRPRFVGDGDDRVTELALRPPENGGTSRLSIGTTWEARGLVAATPHGRVRIDPESRVRLELDAERLRVVVNEGRAAVEAAGESVELRQDDLVESTASGGPGAPRTALENIVADGGFERAIDGSKWRRRVDIPGDAVGIVRPQAEVQRLDDGQTTAVRIVRLDSESRPADLILEQLLGDRDASGASHLAVRARLRVHQQSLPLCGTRGTECPVILKLVGETESGAEHDWRVGFYAVRPPADEPPGKYVAGPTDVEVPAGEWYTFESGNLLDPATPYSLSRFEWPSPPVRLRRFEIIASGHDYAADVDQVELWLK
jgi:hypothetical protein